MVAFHAVMMPTQIVALGGSLLRPEEAEQRSIWFGQLRQMVVHFEGNARKLGIVVGGGAEEAVREILADPGGGDAAGGRDGSGTAT